MTNRNERPAQGFGLPLFAIAAAMTAMAVSLAIVHHPATKARVWVPDLDKVSADKDKTVERSLCEIRLSTDGGVRLRKIEHRAIEKRLDSAEVAILRAVLRDFCKAHGFALDDQRTLETARRLVRLFQGGERDCARLRMLLDIQSMS